MVVFFPVILLRAETGLVFGETLPEEELIFFVGEGELGVPEDDFLLTMGEAVLGTFLPRDEANLELPFLPVIGLAFGDEPLVVVALPIADFLLLVLGEGEALLFDFLFEELTPVSTVVLLNALSIIPITLNSKEVCECPALSGGVKNFSDGAS